MKKILIIPVSLMLLFVLYGLPGLLTGFDPITGTKYDEMAGMVPMISLFLSLVFLLVSILVYFYLKKRKIKKHS